ncbi:MAG: hypothetical protein A2087_06365 [Spirochaetes bacterium GWD1_61_31]|nr:MAG: hypothetical protein A2Y37_09105 [Spirochaetes bacterium GWB1_60_80]OHD30909.1 MAG: hypothetical protein A2004_07545 [Spirochaetes bacterium GWC1_61_12]OHD39976.1 MAG: hypothetical protein A2087_06365 [Spirochaetes bacterium GWD1_61_31]OHD42370.1 MAG: hypothetical protein A2Y35_11635 [Spirochaetes bacterium GWE1_60_18]OHD60542.1 MAG: hypothetical protein A2Y32_03850 [Spirochaetes bacterium GWF1_60_12]HAW85138.1 hypothetical protein [Spirochaetaceae bacterium]
MRLDKVFKFISVAAGATAFVLVLILDMGWIWLLAVLAFTLAARFAIEAVLLLVRRFEAQRLHDLSEYSANQLFGIGDLKAAMAPDGMLQGVPMPVMIKAVCSGSAESAAPLSGRPGLAWRVEAELLEGLLRAAGATRTLQQYWPALQLVEGQDSLPVSDIGLLDGTISAERVLTYPQFRKEFSQLASCLPEAFGFDDDKGLAGLRLRLREIILPVDERVTAYGIAEERRGEVVLTGSDEPEDAESLLLRVDRKPASDRRNRRLPQALLMAALALLCALPGLLIVNAELTKPGAVLDRSHSGPIWVQPQGREFRVKFPDGAWYFDGSEGQTEMVLLDGEENYLTSRAVAVQVERIERLQRVFRNGEAGYPRWDGRQWLLSIGDLDVPMPVLTVAGSGTAPAGVKGRLYFRNLSDSLLAVKVIDPEGEYVQANWNYDPFDGSASLSGTYLNITDKGPLLVGGNHTIEVSSMTGARRLHRVAAVATWSHDLAAWQVDLVPELLAGSGEIYVKNSGAWLVEIRLYGIDGNPLYGDSPWEFAAGEGTDKNLGLSLSHADQSIVFTGREELRIEFLHNVTVAEGALEELAEWRDRSWWLDIDSVLGD